MKITQRMKNELKTLRYVNTRNYMYHLDINYYDGTAYLRRLSMKFIRHQSTACIDGWETIMDVDLSEDKWEVR